MDKPSSNSSEALTARIGSMLGCRGWREPRVLRRAVALYLLVAAIAGLLLAACGGQPSETSAAKPAAEGDKPLSTSLRHVTATAKGGPSQVLMTGQSGTLELRLSLVAGEGRALRWDREAPPPVLRVSSRQDAGISFVGPDGEAPGKGAHRVALTLAAPVGAEDLVARLPYEIDSRARVRNQVIEAQLSAPLLEADGSRVHDDGTFELPVRVESPFRTKIIVIAMIAIAIFLFVVEWVRVDVVAIMMMVSMPMLNLLHSKQTFTGLSSNAVVAIIGVMIVSAGLNKVGLVSRVVAPVIRAAGKSPSRLVVFLSSLIALISSVMQNTGAAVLFLPGIRHASKVMNVSIARVLMPIGMCAILGGTLTMIGTSPLILLNDILPEGVEKFGLLELTPIGAGFVVGGVLYFSTVGRPFLEKIAQAQLARKGGVVERATGTATQTVYHELDGPFELYVPKSYEPPKTPETVVDARRQGLVNIVALADEKRLRTYAPNPDVPIEPGHTLCVYGNKDRVTEFAEEHGFKINERPRIFRDLFNPAVAGTAEAVVSPRSEMIGKNIREIGFRRSYDVTVLAVYREGRTYYKEMSDIPLASGDALLLHSTWEHFHTLEEAHQHFRIITPLEVEIQKPSKATAAIICFVIALTLMLVSSFYFQKLPYNPIPLSVCLMTGALGMVLTGVLSIRDAYHAVDWRTVFLLGGLIPLGMAVDRTGTAEWIATGIVTALGESVTPLVLITVLAVMSGAFCLVISNVGACTLLVPLGASMATQIGIDPRVAAIVVGLGVSNSFLLPTHQVNALYMGPGGYRTKDYMKIGGGMSLIYVAVLVTMTYLFYV
ncbi:MAG: SLC13 family permease [Deltaproteobacteria bacterium]|jgi:di/tricarboxylate transporter|nr:SLC13 family permease [Deltaproteobacteria bacterium]MBW2532966.1 SLC13 family permease [Deltaproteobacteria bacterium]